MKRKESNGSVLFDIFNYFLMFGLMIIMVYPILNVAAISMSSSSAITAGKVTWLPIDFNINGYKIILRNAEIFIAYKNTILYAGVGTIIMLTFTSLAAYALAVKEFVFKKQFTVLLVITMLFSGGLIPTYLVIRSLNLIDSFWVMVLPGCVSAYNIFIFRTFFEGLSAELRESAYIDGANDFIIWYKIFLPLSKPILATFALFGVVGHWNSWFNALLYLNDANKFPLQMILRKMVILDDIRGGAYADSEIAVIMQSINIDPKNVQMAAIIVAMLPILFVYPFIQKYFVKGVMIGAVKG